MHDTTGPDTAAVRHGDADDRQATVPATPPLRGKEEAVAPDRAGIFVILNTKSGRKAGALSIETLEEELDALDGPVTLRRVDHGHHLDALITEAIASGAGTIVAAGGDGTICAVAARLIGTGLNLGVVPMGTFNYFARGNDIPEDTAAAVALLRGGEPRSICVGKVNGRVFLNNASLGAYPAILDQREGIYRRWGRSRMAAYWSVLRVLASFRKPLTMRIVVDGVEHRRRSPLAFVAMSAYQLEQYELEGAEAVRDGQFALYVAPDTGRMRLILRAVLLAWRRLRPGRDVELITGRSIEIDTRRKRRLIARDGEKEEMSDPFTFVVVPDALRLMVPKRSDRSAGDATAGDTADATAGDEGAAARAPSAPGGATPKAAPAIEPGATRGHSPRPADGRAERGAS